MSAVSGYPLAPVAFTQSGSYGQARACVKLFPGGAIKPQVFNISSFRIGKASYGAANTASFTVPYNSNPDWTQMLLRGDGAAVADNLPIYVEIWAGFPSNPSSSPNTVGLNRRFYGIIDIDTPDNMEKTTFNCRSIAAPLCTDKISTAVQNLTTVQFLQQVAAQYGIQVYVDPTLTQPFTLAKVYGHDFLVGLKNLYKWDVLVRSAACDDVFLWEDQGVLFYVHPWNVDRAAIKLVYGSNVKSFIPSHSPQFNRNIEVFVHSYTDQYPHLGNDAGSEYPRL